MPAAQPPPGGHNVHRAVCVSDSGAVQETGSGEEDRGRRACQQCHRARRYCKSRLPPGGAMMNFVAIKMLTGDRSKYLGLIFAIAFASFLLENQSSIFAGIMKRTTSQILDVTDADIWVMDNKTLYIDEVKALTDNDLYRVRGVPGVLWAVRLFKGQPRAKALDGTFRVVIMMGLDDASLVGAPARDKMLLGAVDDLRQPDA